jgi:hypothetical protein
MPAGVGFIVRSPGKQKEWTQPEEGLAAGRSSSLNNINSLQSHSDQKNVQQLKLATRPQGLTSSW